MSIALGEVELDLETNAVFGNLAKDSAQAFAAALTGLSPAVHPQLGKRGRPSDSSHSGGRNHGQGQGSKGQGKGGKGGKTSPQVTALVKAMGRLVIRQETQLQILKQNSAWWVYLQPGVNGPIPVLFKAAEKYKEQAKVKFMESPIRAVLLSTLFLTLSHCLQTLSTDANQQKSARDKGWLTQGNEWRYQKWDADNQVLHVMQPPILQAGWESSALSGEAAFTVLCTFRFLQIPEECLAADHRCLALSRMLTECWRRQPTPSLDGMARTGPQPHVCFEMWFGCTSFQVTVSKCEKAVFWRCSAARPPLGTERQQSQYTRFSVCPPGATHSSQDYTFVQRKTSWLWTLLRFCTLLLE